MLVLALDASTPVATVAVGEIEGEKRTVLAEVSLPGAGASETLLRTVEAALSLAGRELPEVERFLVGVGPGTFTGIRIAAATARSLALGTGASLSKNSTLAALAAPALGARREVLAVLDARRGEVFARRFSMNDDASGEGGEDGIFCAKPGELSGRFGPLEAPLVVGDGAVRYRNELSALGDVPPDCSSLNRVSAAGHLLCASFEAVEAGEVLPIYVREPDAEVRRDLNPWLDR